MSFSGYTTKTKEQLFKELNVSEGGLSNEEAKKRLTQYGYNVIAAQEVTWFDVLLRQFKSPFLYLLIFASILTFFLGEELDTLMILIFVGINVVLGFYQEFRSEQTLKLLKRYVEATCKVLRDNEEKVVKTEELVPGDIVILEPGDIVPSDIRFIHTQDLLVDESILSGESAPVKKVESGILHEVSAIYLATNIGFSGTSVVKGKGKGLVIGTGKNTSIGEISKLTVETSHVSSFEKRISKFSEFILRLILVTLILLFLANIFIKGWAIDIVKLAVFSIALAVSVVPEALPVVTTFSLSQGALKLARHHVVVKRLSAIEDLGGVEVLCTDKTGTLTENKLNVDEEYPTGGQAVLFGAQASPPLKEVARMDPFDIALLDRLSAAEKASIKTFKKIDTLPFDPEKRFSGVLLEKNNTFWFIIRGAYEEVIKMCKKESGGEVEKIHHWVQNKGKEGFRIVAVAKKEVAQKTLELEKVGSDFTFLGVVSFVDPIKATVAKAIEDAEALGLKIKILTGDSSEVAHFVGSKIGLIKKGDQVLRGEELEKLSHDQKQAAVEKYSVFARVTPSQKYNIIQLLQKKYEVGFLGEGINDAPALKIANVAIVVQSASDIAREAADIVLLKKSLSVIIDGIQEGRHVFINTIKYVKATLSANFGNFYAVSIASFFIPFLPMLPLQILLVNLLTDFPMITVATDNVDPDEAKMPKKYDMREMTFMATLLGLVSTVFDFIFFGLFYQQGEHVLQTNWFMGSILTELVFLFSVRTKLFVLKARAPSKVLIILSLIAFTTTIILPFTGIGKNIFSFTPPTMIHLGMILSVVFVYFVVTESAKLLYYSKVHPARVH